MAALVTRLGRGGVRDKGKDAKITCRVLGIVLRTSKCESITEVYHHFLLQTSPGITPCSEQGAWLQLSNGFSSSLNMRLKDKSPFR